jgi:hypothetical protein
LIFPFARGLTLLPGGLETHLLRSSVPVPNGHICSSLKCPRLGHVCTRDLLFKFQFSRYRRSNKVINHEVGNKNVQRSENREVAPHKRFSGIDELTQGKGTRSKCAHLVRGLNCVVTAVRHKDIYRHSLTSPAGRRTNTSSATAHKARASPVYTIIYSYLRHSP